MDRYTGVDGTMSLSDVQNMQGGPPPGEGQVTYDDVLRAFLANNEPKNVYVNYGDVNPEDHGGLFVKANTNRNTVSFDVVETIPADLVMDAEDSGHYVNSGVLYFDDIVADDGKWTNLEIPSYTYGADSSPLGAAVDNRMLEVVAGYAPLIVKPDPWGNNRATGSYEEILYNKGVSPRKM